MKLAAIAAIAAALGASAIASAAMAQAPGALPTGKYTGTSKSQREVEMSFDVETSSGERFNGTVVVPHVPAPCNRPFPMTGEVLANGVVKIESRGERVILGCERSYDLKLLPGNQLVGTVLGPYGKGEVSVTRR